MFQVKNRAFDEKKKQKIHKQNFYIYTSIVLSSVRHDHWIHTAGLHQYLNIYVEIKRLRKIIN